MKKDKYGTIVGTTAKAPYGYGACEVCGHKNVHLDAGGDLAPHGSARHGVASCPGSGERPANPTRPAQKHLFILSVKQTNNPPHIWDPRFAFHASNDADAKRKADGWARYQGKTPDDVGVTPVPSKKDLPYTKDFIHDDWIERGR